MSSVEVATRDVVAELRKLGVAEVDDTTLARALYSTDASLYRVIPQVVVRPRSVEEVLATVEACRLTGTPLTSRGAGTSIAGNAVGTGVVIDFTRHLNRVHDIDVEARTARVDPGTVHAVLQKAASPFGLRFGPDPSTHTRCTVGGMIGNNACGSRALAYGRTADNVVGLDVVTMAGEQLSVTAGGRTESPTLDRLDEVVQGGLGVIRTEFGRFGRQVSGYSLEHLLPERGFDVATFLAGTEGTLATMTSATVRLVEDPPHRQILVLGYASMADAADDVPALLPFGPTACEGLDSRIVDVFRMHKGSVPELPRGQGWLFVEISGDDPGLVADTVQRASAASSAIASRVVTDVREQAVLWRIREEGAGLATRTLPGKALSGWEDAAVPPDKLGTYLREFESLLRDRGLDGVPYGHFGDGCIHIRIDFPLDAPGGKEVFRSFMFDAASLVASHGGSFSGEHGDGRARSELLHLMYSAEAIDLFAQVKAVLDPDDLLNPGVLVRPRPVDADLRGPESSLDRLDGRLGLRLLHDDGDFGKAVHRCTGVGKCIADNAGSNGVMCPSFQATRNEKDSTRGRARVLQEMIDGRLVTGGFRAAEVHEALDLCLSCKGCASDCPTGTDMATYKSEVLHQSYKGRLRPRSHYILGRLPFWARVTSPIAWLANLGLRTPGVRSLARWAAGVDQRRSLPTFARGSLSRWARRRTPVADAPRGRVLLWADSFTDFFSTEGGKAAVRVLEGAGYRVELLARSACCGLTWITTGQLDKARSIVGNAVAQLHPYVMEGVPVVGLEPSCLAVLRSDAVELLDDPRAVDVARGVFTLSELLQRTEGWRAPDLTGTTLVVQPHCHQASVLGFEADLAIMQSTGATIQRLSGCCGLAGNFGVEKGHYEVSVAVAEQQLLPAVRNAGDSAIVVADGFSCRTQLDDLASIDALHLAQLLDP
ncbi:FAD-binding and (Fe-S)-binding domain-containing protein [Aeromicrobium ginsengisoli]|uniref:FAD-binding and (Fe-S)-binding domain-containing protein n=1 Tax=Aeromicrobium ginsengisoli TaxID=363867 RepID=UPI001FE6921F|nr:FAD-binding and (Fe-S)-binding domain-containing protein [Aeromicrobium ginsengisoli]